MNKASYLDFFMGANSPIGFCTYYDELTVPVVGARSYLIKGGAGTGKSSLIKRIAAECPYDDEAVELIHCSSDPNSLDGVILTRKKISMVDATPPHVIEPQYPGCYQTVINICEYFDYKKMSSRLEETVRLQTANNDCHKKCCRLLKCAALLLEDNRAVVSRATDFTKITALANRIIKREFKQTHRNGVEHKRLLSAITNRGVVAFEDTITAAAKRTYLIKDEYGASSAALMKQLHDGALAAGYEIYTCHCPMDQCGRIEHLIIPALSLAFVTQHRFVPFDADKLKPVSVISYTRFTDAATLKAHKQFLSFNRRAATDFIESAVETLRLAKTIHDDLELQYTDAVDFAGVNTKADAIVAEINAV